MTYGTNLMEEEGRSIWLIPDFKNVGRPQMSIKMSPSERGDSISPQGSANACENINGGIFKFEQENMEKIQDEV